MPLPADPSERPKAPLAPAAGDRQGSAARAAGVPATVAPPPPNWRTPIDEPALARRLGVSVEAVQLARHVGTIDLHIEPWLTRRLWRADLGARGGGLPWGGRYFGHLDFPRMAEGGLSAAMWSITTQPFTTAQRRWRAFLRNVEGLRSLFESTQGRYRAVRTASELEQALRDGAHGAMISVQGGNALEAAPAGEPLTPGGWLLRVTLLHLTNSVYGVTSSPLALWRRGGGLTPRGKAMVERLNAERVFVDLAHINREGFWDAIDAHDHRQPLLVTHTGVQAVTRSWRNLDDDQLRAVAKTGGTIGVIYAQQFVRRRGQPNTGRRVVDHIEHIIDVLGDEFVSIGTDYDGAITPPPDLRSGDSYPRLVQHMLDAGFGVDRIQRILRDNFLRTLRHLRPE